jgi:hypothetical protein
VWLGGTAAAQDSTLVLDDIGEHRDTIDTFQPQPYALRPFILPGTETIRVGGTRLDTSEYRLDAREGQLWIRRENLLETRDTLFAAYRTLPLGLQSVYRRRTPASALPDTGTVAVTTTGDTAAADAFDPFEGVQIERSGSVSRGLVGGTNRDVNIESGLRMQLEGEVAEDIRIRALLSDQNTPLQPDGSTQRLRNFDRVFLEMNAPQGTARLGDVDASVDGGSFARFARKVQGVQLQSDELGAVAPGVDATATAFGAVSRGQYRTQDIAPRDGVQGPYRLRDDRGQTPVVVVAGSETVYLDGEQLTRGRTNDYVIDYARGEITFSSNRLITDDRRITVEFQYTRSPFSRTIAGGQAEAGAWQNADGDARVSVGATFLRQADGDEFRTAFDLTRQDSLRLATAGDERATRSGAERVAFDPEAPYVHYRREVRAAPGGGQDTVFVALEEAPDDESPVYRVRFTRVGTGEGAYERAGRTANGVVYAYTGPERGAYAPVEPLPAPAKQQLLDLTGSVEPVDGVEVFGEWGRSLRDQNRFSSLDAANDEGSAYVAGVRVAPTPVGIGGTTVGELSGRVRRTSRTRNFETFGQTRPIEFARRWNVSRSGSGLPSSLAGRGTETADFGSVRMDLGGASVVEAEGGRLRVGSVFEAWRQKGRLAIQASEMPRLDAQVARVRSTDRVGGAEGTWRRQQATLRQPFWGGALEPRIRVEREERSQYALDTDSLTRDAFSFWEVRPGVTYEAGPVTASGEVTYRAEEQALEGAFRNASEGWTAKSDVAYHPSAPYRVSVTGGYRVREVSGVFRRRRQREDTESIVLQVKGEAQPLDRALDLRLFYDAVTKRTPTLREVYVRTGGDLGQYVWRDSNGDGLQQVDEFVPETTPNEGAYVRSFVPSDSLTSVVDLQARLRASMRPGRVWRGSGVWWKQALSTVTTTSTVEVQEKSRSEAVTRIYGLDLRRYRQPGTTVDGELNLEQTVALFESRRAYGLDVSWRQVRGLSERAAGTQSSFLNRWRAEAEVRPAVNWEVRVRGSVERDRSTSEAFSASRGYDIRAVAGRPSVSYRPTQALTVTLSGAYARKQDRAQGRQASVLKVPVKVEWVRASRLRLTGNVEVAEVDLGGDAVGRARYQLTDGRGPGTSALWGLQARYRFSEILDATLSYDGRAPASAPVIHTARVQLSASF